MPKLTEGLPACVWAGGAKSGNTSNQGIKNLGIGWGAGGFLPEDRGAARHLLSLPGAQVPEQAEN